MSGQDKPSSLRMRIQRKLKVYGRKPRLVPILVVGAVVVVAAAALYLAFRGGPQPEPAGGTPPAVGPAAPRPEPEAAGEPEPPAPSAVAEPAAPLAREAAPVPAPGAFAGLDLYLPLDEGRLLAHPATARTTQRGEPLFREAKRGTGLVIDSKGRSVAGLTVTGTALADPAQGTIAFWMNPLVDYGAGRHVLLNLFSSGNRDEALHLFIEGGSLYLQSRAGGKWPGAHFHFDWIGKPSWRRGTWYHVAVTWGREHPTVFYVDGRMTWKSETKLGFDGAEAPVDRIEVGSSAGKQQADAVLDEILVFDEVLDEGRIGDLMSMEKVRVPEGRPVRQAPPPSAAAFEAALPPGVKRVWDLAKAYRETTPTRERICINGLWRWQPTEDTAGAVPTGGWGFFKVPGAWPGISNYLMKDSQIVHTHPAWRSTDIRGVATAWYQRRITVPRAWTGRRIALSAEYVNSFAVVHVDGREAGVIRFPAGEVDLTAACRPGRTHTLSLRVTAMPLNDVMLSFNDTDLTHRVKGRVQRRGLCGDVYLCATPAGARIDEVKIDPSVRKWEMTLSSRLAGLDPAATYRLQAEVHDDGRVIKRLDSDPFGAADLADGRFTFTSPWKPDKLWDTHTPGNMYTLQLSLLNGGEVCDSYLPVRFGFRELWLDGRDIYFNGTRFLMSAVPLDNAQVGAAWSTYEAAVESMKRLMTYGVNMVFTHNYGCEPGAHLGFEEILRAADDVGMLVSLSQPHFGHYDWSAADAEEKNGYVQHAAFYVRVAQNHPSVVFYSTSHNSTGDSHDMDPDRMGCRYPVTSRWALNNREKAARAEAIIRRLDPSRVVYHHSSGNFGSMHTSNFYTNWVPVQEMADWFEHWSTEGDKPVFLCEYGVPESWDWSMYRGWYEGKRTFGSAKVPWEFCLAEWNAQFFGDAAFRISEREARNLRWEADKIRAGELWHRWDYPTVLGSVDFIERDPVYAMYYTESWRALRTWGLSGTNVWDNQQLHACREGLARNARQTLETDWENLQRPGFSPDFLQARYERFDLAYERRDWIVRECGKALMRNNGPLLAYVGGGGDAFTGKDHNFVAGQAVEKQIIVLNNSRETVTCACAWTLDLRPRVRGARRVSVKTGEQERVPLRFDLPAGTVPGTYELNATMKFSSGEEQTDSLTIHVMPAPRKARARSRTALFDPKGETRKLLEDLGLGFRTVEATTDLAAYDTLIIGKEALTVRGPGPDVGRVRDGLKLIVFEQTPEVLEARLGFRIAAYGLRRVFMRVPDHPLLRGLTPEHLRDWRGASTVLPPRVDTTNRGRDYGRVYKWAGIPVTRVYRCGNRGTVASALIEKPACGDFLPIVDGGFSLQYSPLLVYREGAGLVVFCQMDVTGRTERDPAADTLVHNIVSYVSSWKPTAAREVVYAGEAAGREHLERAGFAVRPYAGGLMKSQVLVVGPGGGTALAADAGRIASGLKAGGAVLALALDESEANAFLPVKVRTTKAEHVATYFETPAADSLLAGVGPADVHNRDPRQMPLITGGAQSVGDGVLAELAAQRIVFCQMAPWQFPYKIPQGAKRTFRRTSCVLARLLGNLGVRGDTPLLGRFSSGVARRSGEEVEGITVWLEQGDRMKSLPSRWKGLPLAKNASPPAGWDSATFNDAAWRKIRVPGLWEDQFTDLENHDGLFLYRTAFELPADMAGGDVVLVLGAIDDEDWTFVNGRPVGSVTAKTNPGDYWMAVRRYRVPAAVLRPGRNILAVKVNDLRQAGGIKGMASAGPPRAVAGRWMRGLYLDEPEEWDDPYRFFRW